MIRRILAACIALAAAAALGLLLGQLPGAASDQMAAPAAPAACSPSFSVVVTFTNGGRWDMCWESRAKEGVVYRDGYYTPPGNPQQKIFSQLGIGQIFVPYDPGSPRFHDMSDFGIGSNHVTLDGSDCVDGKVLNDGAKDMLCQQVFSHGLRYLYGSVSAQKEALGLWSSAQIGAYNYVLQWNFHDDGTIEPVIGATGRLQYVDTSSAQAQYGWPIGPNRWGRSHIHTLYYRLDFDLGPAGNDAVEQYEFGGSGGTARRIFSTTLSTETAAQYSTERFRFWRIVDTATTNADGHRISYEIAPKFGYLHRNQVEPWTLNDVYVTNYAAGEICATHNASNCGGTGSDVSAFVNGETVTDPVVWLSVTFHHVPRDEDETNMPLHWESFKLYPRDLTSVNPTP
ncbi:MAG: hypothetical protein KA750_01550 [Thermoflexales bacterium]|nr:hypothetical protein [Thermoflexales bacterium]